MTREMGLVARTLYLDLTKQAEVVRTKRAEPEAAQAPTLAPPPLSHDAYLDRHRADAWRQIAGVALLSGLTGAGLRGLLGRNYFFGPARSDEKGLPRFDTATLPQPVFSTQKEKDKAVKTANNGGDRPWQLLYPGLAAAGIGGTYAGYKLMDTYLDSKRKKDLQDEVARARREYQEALLTQYDPSQIPTLDELAAQQPLDVARAEAGTGKAPIVGSGLTYRRQAFKKKAGFTPAAELGADLDYLARLIEIREAFEKKAATYLDQAPGWLKQLVGMYGAFSVPLALGTGIAAYKYTKDRSSKKLVEEAIRQRERERYLRRPPEVTVLPDPVVAEQGRIVEKNPIGE